MRPNDFGITNHEGEVLRRRTTFDRRRFGFLSKEKKHVPGTDRSTDKPLSYNDDLPGLMAQPFSVSNPPRDGPDSSEDDGRGTPCHTHTRPRGTIIAA